MIGLIAPADPRAKEYERLSEITRQLKVLAMQLGIVIVELCQLNRQGGLGEIPMQWRPQYHDWLPVGSIYPQDVGGFAGPEFEEVTQQ